ncbi:MAG: ParA family protein [Gallionella sp.]|nr:ParA family protein [Gallionella sp.]
MLTILVINSKGGSGKTTLTTNLAGYYASKKIKTALMDYDPQGSSMQWLKMRPGHAEKIHGANAAPPKGATIQRSAQAWIPVDTDVLIVDAPAGTKGLLLQELVRRTNFIVIPVAPSPIDIHATADFVKELFLYGGARTSKAKIAVVANRVRSASSVYASLERFLNSLKLPFLTSIRDSEIYLQAVEKGLGVFEMDEAVTAAERRELLPILNWVEGHYLASEKRLAAFPSQENLLLPKSFGSRLEDKVISLETFSSTGKFKKLS